MRLSAAPSGHRYNLEIAGCGAPLLMLHGFTGAAATWRALCHELADDFRLICLDILGHGESDSPADVSSYRMSAIAADIIDLLDQLDLPSSHLLGYSMGGRLALYLALRQPDRFGKLILESASPGLANAAEREARRRADEDLAEKIEARGIHWFVEAWERLPLWKSQAQLPPEVLAAQRAQRLRNDRRGLAQSLRGMGSGAQPSLWQALPQLQLPTLLLVGELDAKFRRVNLSMATELPNAALRVIVAAGHNTHLEQRAAFTQALRSFLQGS